MARRKAEGGRSEDNPRGARETHHPSPITHHPAQPGRRRFMVGAAGLTFGIALGAPRMLRAQAAAAKHVAVNPWVTLYTDGTVVIMSPAAEMGQGSLTSLPRIVADEMDADWSKVKIVPAYPSGKLYGNPLFGGEQYTAGSATVTGYFNSLRQERSCRRAYDDPGVCPA